MKKVNAEMVNCVIEKYKKLIVDNSDCRSFKAEIEWVDCYSSFQKAWKDGLSVDELAKSLSSFLASWGMNRNSFIAKCDHTIHCEAISIISKHKELNNLTCRDVEKNKTSLINLVGELKEYYSGVRESVMGREIKSDISSTLISKVLLVSLACVPAYDSVLPLGLQEFGIKPKSFGINSILSVSEHFKDIEYDDKEITVKEVDYCYPEMKLIDMCCWGIIKAV